MKRDDVQSTLDRVRTYFPKSKWPQEIIPEFCRRLERMPLTLSQAFAALDNLKLAKPYADAQPADILKALGAACPSERPDSVADDIESDRKLVMHYVYNNREALLPLLIELHAAEPRTPRHFMDAWSCYAAWPVSCRRLASRLRELKPNVSRNAA